MVVGNHRRLPKRCVRYKVVYSPALGKNVRRCADYEYIGTARARLGQVA